MRGSGYSMQSKNVAKIATIDYQRRLEFPGWSAVNNDTHESDWLWNLEKLWCDPRIRDLLVAQVVVMKT